MDSSFANWISGESDGSRETPVAQPTAHHCYQDFEVIESKGQPRKHLRPVILEPLRAAREQLATLEQWTREGIAQTIEEVAATFEISMGKLGQPIRVAVTGGSVSPPIDVTVCLVGRERTLKRLDQAIELIEARAAASSS